MNLELVKELKIIPAKEGKPTDQDKETFKEVKAWVDRLVESEPYHSDKKHDTFWRGTALGLELAFPQYRGILHQILFESKKEEKTEPEMQMKSIDPNPKRSKKTKDCAGCKQKKNQQAKKNGQKVEKTASEIQTFEEWEKFFSADVDKMIQFLKNIGVNPRNSRDSEKLFGKYQNHLNADESNASK